MDTAFALEFKGQVLFLILLAFLRGRMDERSIFGCSRCIEDAETDELGDAVVCVDDIVTLLDIKKSVHRSSGADFGYSSSHT